MWIKILFKKLLDKLEYREGKFVEINCIITVIKYLKNILIINKFNSLTV